MKAAPYQTPLSPIPQVQPPSSPPAQQQQFPHSSGPLTTITQPVEERTQAPPANTQGTGRRIGLDHFNFLAVLGKGNFGKVMLAETKTTKQLYAIKVLKKEFIIENDEVESVRSEKRVLLIANKERHPFLINLHACFQTETRVYFVMEYVSGGDLMLHIQRGHFGTRRAQFYAAEVCLALKYFHENGVIYRDLKLDNIMLTLDGHIKVADYGLCKEDMWYGSTTSTFCGTPEFMAPEILLDKKYGRAVDWWAFGVLIYQMLLQQSPFRGEDEDEIYDAILADEPLYPIHMPRDSVSILQKLLTREPELRLGSGPTDAQEIMSHAFFRNINWDDIYHKRIPAPFLPTVKNRADTSNFDSEFTSVTPVLTPVQSGKYRSLSSDSIHADRIRSTLPSDARRIQGLFVLRRLCLRDSVRAACYLKVRSFEGGRLGQSFVIPRGAFRSIAVRNFFGVGGRARTWLGLDGYDDVGPRDTSRVEMIKGMWMRMGDICSGVLGIEKKYMLGVIVFLQYLSSSRALAPFFRFGLAFTCTASKPYVSCEQFPARWSFFNLDPLHSQVFSSLLETLRACSNVRSKPAVKDRGDCKNVRLGQKRACAHLAAMPMSQY